MPKVSAPTAADALPAELLADRAHQSDAAVMMVTHDRDMLEHCYCVLEVVDGRLDGALRTH